MLQDGDMMIYKILHKGRIKFKPTCWIVIHKDMNFFGWNGTYVTSNKGFPRI